VVVYMRAQAENFGAVVDSSAVLVLVGRLAEAVVAVDILCMVVVQAGLERSQQDCQHLHWLVYRSLGKNASQKGQEFRNLCKHE
jgi:hypothetical protein